VQDDQLDSVMAITKRLDVVFVAGQGSWLTDSEGRSYLDFIQGWAVNTLGHSPRQIADALAAGESADQLQSGFPQ
jgi:acetylornithine/N-succinyldiaminopimelate aminotransferase